MPIGGGSLNTVKQKLTAPAWNQDTDSQEAVREAVDVIDGFHDVPTADVGTNAQVRDVVGNKTDAAVTTVGTTKSLMAYLKGLVSWGGLGITAKDRSLLGSGAFKGFQDYFGDGGTANVAKSAYWTEETVGASPGTVTIVSTTASLPAHLSLYSGADNSDSAKIHSDNKYKISPFESDITTVHLRFRGRITVISAAAAEFTLGLVNTDNTHYAMINSSASGPAYLSKDGTTQQATTAAADIAQNTWYTFEIRWTETAVAFFVNDVLKATHSTYFPLAPCFVTLLARRATVSTNVDIQWVQLWGE